MRHKFSLFIVVKYSQCSLIFKMLIIDSYFDSRYKFIWQGWQDLNPQHIDLKSTVLPLNYMPSGLLMAGIVNYRSKSCFADESFVQLVQIQHRQRGGLYMVPTPKTVSNRPILLKGSWTLWVFCSRQKYGKFYPSTNLQGTTYLHRQIARSCP